MHVHDMVAVGQKLCEHAVVKSHWNSTRNDFNLMLRLLSSFPLSFCAFIFIPYFPVFVFYFAFISVSAAPSSALFNSLTMLHLLKPVI
jgi:hypothetical protein